MIYSLYPKESINEGAREDELILIQLPCGIQEIRYTYQGTRGDNQGKSDNLG